MRNLKKALAATLVGAACLAGTASAVPVKGVSDNDTAYWDRAAQAGADSIRFDFANDEHTEFTGTEAYNETVARITAAINAGLTPVVTFQFPTRSVYDFSFAAAWYGGGLWNAGLRYIEIGNEWNTSTFWDPTGAGTLAPNPQLAAEITYSSAYALKNSMNNWYGVAEWDTVGHDFTIITGGTAPGDCITNSNDPKYDNELPAHEYFHLFRGHGFTHGIPNTNVFDNGYVDAVGHHPYTSATSGDVSPDPTRTTGDYAYNDADARGWQRYMVSTTATACANYWNTVAPSYQFKSIRSNMDTASWGDGNDLSSMPIWNTEFASWSKPTSTWNETEQNGVATDALNLWDSYRTANPSKWGPFFWYSASDRGTSTDPFSDNGPGLFRSDSPTADKPVMTTFYNATL